MYQDKIPSYIISKYPTQEAFLYALSVGDILRDQCGNFHLREEVQPQPFYSQQYQLYAVNPDRYRK